MLLWWYASSADVLHNRDRRSLYIITTNEERALVVLARHRISQALEYVLSKGLTVHDL